MYNSRPCVLNVLSIHPPVPRMRRSRLFRKLFETQFFLSHSFTFHLSKASRGSECCGACRRLCTLMFYSFSRIKNKTEKWPNFDTQQWSFSRWSVRLARVRCLLLRLSRLLFASLNRRRFLRFLVILVNECRCSPLVPPTTYAVLSRKNSLEVFLIDSFGICVCSELELVLSYIFAHRASSVRYFSMLLCHFLCTDWFLSDLFPSEARFYYALLVLLLL